ncbi:hypothetical protein H8D30_00415 [bacterium]|nr:hypothetical protein [bacterium]
MILGFLGPFTTLLFCRFPLSGTPNAHNGLPTHPPPALMIGASASPLYPALPRPLRNLIKIAPTEVAVPHSSHSQPEALSRTDKKGNIR